MPRTAELAAMHLVGNALLLWLGYYWLGIGESTNARLLWSACVFVCFVAGVLWLHAMALAHFDRQGARSLAESAQLTLRHLLPLFVVLLIAVLVYDLLEQWKNAIEHQGFLLASFLTLHLRRPGKPETMRQVLQVILWLLRWAAAPAVFLAGAARVAKHGWRGFRVRLGLRKRVWLYWAEVCVLIVCAVWAPLKLLAWVPKFESFNWQLVSFCLRLGAGYLLFVSALLALEFLTSAGRPERSQLNAAASP
jgi:hypothetical protein